MSTFDITATTDWVDITTALGLVEGIRYTIDNVDGGVAYIRESATKPTSTYGHIIKEEDNRSVIGSTLKFWIRSSNRYVNLVITPEV